MAALFGAEARAPLTAILIVFEPTNDGLVLPLILAAGIATIVADRWQPDSLYTYPLRKPGIVYAEPQGIDLM
jgi:CIC family chloride channel protein